MPILALGDLAFFTPVRDNSRSLCGSHIESGHCDKVIRSDLNVCALAALKIDG